LNIGHNKGYIKVVMMLIKAFGASIFYVQNNNQIFEYNLITKQRHLRYKTKLIIQDYYISRDNKIVIGNIINSRIINIIWNGRQFTIPFGCKSSFVKICGHIYVVFGLGIKTIICDLNGNIAFFQYNIYINVSENMEQLILVRNSDICVLRNNEQIINPDNYSESYQIQIKKFEYLRCIVPIDFYNPLGLLIIDRYERCFAQWISNSNRIIILSTDFDDSYTLLNIKTLKQCNTKVGYSTNNIMRLLEIKNDRFVTIDDYHINVYSIDTMNFIKRIYCGLEFIRYSKLFDLLISSEWEYYRITSNIELQKIYRIGYNYFEDKDCVPNIIKTIMDIVYIFQIPSEILYTELYYMLYKTIIDPFKSV